MGVSVGGWVVTVAEGSGVFVGVGVGVSVGGSVVTVAEGSGVLVGVGVSVGGSVVTVAEGSGVFVGVGVSGVGPAMEASASAACTNPAPYSFGLPRLRAVPVKIDSISAGEALGFFSSSRAVTAATCGEAIDVPSKNW